MALKGPLLPHFASLHMTPGNINVRGYVITDLHGARYLYAGTFEESFSQLNTERNVANRDVRTFKTLHISAQLRPMCKH